MARIGLVFDCADPEQLAEFWSAALGCTTLGGAGSYVLLVEWNGPLPKLLLRRVPEPKTTKTRMHLDIECPDVAGESARLEGRDACPGADVEARDHVGRHARSRGRCTRSPARATA